MSSVQIVRCTVVIETQPPQRRFGWVVRAVASRYLIPFRSDAERADLVRLLAEYGGSAVDPRAVENLAALLCLHHDDEAATQLAAHYLERDYAALLVVMPLEEVNETIERLLDQAAAHEEARQ